LIELFTTRKSLFSNRLLNYLLAEFSLNNLVAEINASNKNILPQYLSRKKIKNENLLAEISANILKDGIFCTLTHKNFRQEFKK
jgi:hypothetical protein